MTTNSDASQAVELPPLPEPYFGEPANLNDTHLGPCFVQADMEAYARAAIAQDRAARAQGAGEAVTRIATCDRIFVHQSYHPPLMGENAVPACPGCGRRKLYRDGAGQWTCPFSGRSDGTDRETYTDEELGLTAPTTPQAAEVPGFVLVPREPTNEMMMRGTEWIRNHYVVGNCYRVMLAAAPTPTASAPKAEGEALSDSKYGLGLIKFSDPIGALRCLARRLREAGISDAVADDYAESIEFLIARRDDLTNQPPSEADRTREGGDVDSEGASHG